LLLALAAAQAAGIVLADRGWLGTEAASALAIVALALGLRLRRARGMALAALGLAAAAGAASLSQRLDAAARFRPSAPEAVILEGSVTSVRREPSGLRIELCCLAAAPARAGAAGARARLRATAEPALAPALRDAVPGDRLRVRVRLSPPTPVRNPGGRDTARTLARAGIGALARPTHPALAVRVPEREGLRPLHWLHAVRRARIERLRTRGPAGALLAVLAFGEGGLSDATRAQFAQLGISHLLAVSGLHLALVASALYASACWLLSRSAALCARRDSRALGAAVAFAGACGYALLAGFGVPVRRALCVVLGTLLALRVARPRSGLAPLAGAALWVLAREPGALFLPGPQLSFAAAAALAWAARRDTGSGRRRGAALRASCLALSVTAPIAAWHFGGAAPAALLANLVAIPWTACALLPAALLAGASASAAPWLGGGWLLAVAEALARASLAAVAWGASHAPALALGGRPAWPWLGLATLLAVGALRARSTLVRVGLALAVSLVLARAPVTALAPAPPRLVVLDVGQGDALLVQGAQGALLVDAGAALPNGLDLGRRSVVPALRALGVRRLDLMVASHADLDHRGGLPAVLAALPVGELWLPPGGRREPAFAALRERALRMGVPLRERGQGDPARVFGDLRVTPLWPPPGATGGARNERSLVLRVEVGRRRVLLAGDIGRSAESALLRAGADVGADVLVLPHHGSRGSSSEAFLAAVDASVAVVSTPCWSRFGMPHAETRQRVRRAGLPLWWTGRDGAVLVALGRVFHVWPYAPSRVGCGADRSRSRDHSTTWSTSR
jgi:competence protein ComEC